MSSDKVVSEPLDQSNKLILNLENINVQIDDEVVVVVVVFPT